MDGSVRLLVRREKLTQDLNEYLASDLDKVHRSRLWMGSWWLRSASSTSRESPVPPAAAATTSRTSWNNSSETFKNIHSKIFDATIGDSRIVLYVDRVHLAAHDF